MVIVYASSWRHVQELSVIRGLMCKAFIVYKCHIRLTCDMKAASGSNLFENVLAVGLSICSATLAAKLHLSFKNVFEFFVF